MAGTRPAAYCPRARISASLANRPYHSARSRAMRFECKSGANRSGARSAPACSGRYGVSCMMKAIDISARPNAAHCAGAMLAFGAFRLETLSPTKCSTNPDANGFAANCPAQSDHFSSAIRWESGRFRIAHDHKKVLEPAFERGPNVACPARGRAQSEPVGQTLGDPA